jgi:hypothetical protein
VLHPGSRLLYAYAGIRRAKLREEGDQVSIIVHDNIRVH